MIPKLDRKWSRTENDPRCGPQMIPPENEEWHGVWFPGFFLFIIYPKKLELFTMVIQYIHVEYGKLWSGIICGAVQNELRY